MSPHSYPRVLGRLLLAIGAGAIATNCGEEAGDSCPGGQTERFCLGTEAMTAMARHGAGQIGLDPPRSDAEVAAGFDVNGCMRHDWVASSCCNKALGAGQPEGEQCCYVACAGACCGRALVIAERTLVSAAEPRADWLLADGTRAEAPYAAHPPLTPAERARLVQLWQADALMEHASIASFARFALQLLALGAPARLVRDAHSAGLDEIRHAEHAFSIASRLAGREIGPGKLADLAAPLDTDLPAVALAALLEGCVGETLAAVLALEQAEQAGDAAIRETLLTVAEDETRHAELAFRFLAWSLDQGGRELREALRLEVERRLQRLPEPVADAALSLATLHHYGRLSADEQRAVYRRTCEQILRPSFSALFRADRARAADAALHA